MSGALDDLKKKIGGKVAEKLMNEIKELKEEQQKTNEILEDILDEVRNNE